MFTVGEKVVYPAHGAGIVEAVEQREILGEQRDYYVLRMTSGELRVLVPVDGVVQAGLRAVSTPDKWKEVVAILSGEDPVQLDWEVNWNKRYRANLDKIKSGDICALAQVIRSLYHRDSARGLAAGEKKMLDKAKSILLSEVVLSAGLDQEDAAQRLETYLSAGETDR